MNIEKDGLPKVNIRIEFDGGEPFATTYVDVLDFQQTDSIVRVRPNENQTVIIPISRIFSITITEKE